jgi:hypothetical protein
LSIWISCFKVLFGCKGTFEHLASLNSEKKLCGNIFIELWGKLLMGALEIPRLEYQ